MSELKQCPICESKVEKHYTEYEHVPVVKFECGAVYRDWDYDRIPNSGDIYSYFDDTGYECPNIHQVVSTLRAEVAALTAKLDQVRANRGGRMLLEGKTFISIRDDEPYYCHVYGIIRGHEQATGRWSVEDEAIFQQQIKSAPRGDPAAQAEYEAAGVAELRQQRNALLAAAKASMEDCLLVICEEDAVFACKEVMRRLEAVIVLCEPKESSK